MNEKNENLSQEEQELQATFRSSSSQQNAEAMKHHQGEFGGGNEVPNNYEVDKVVSPISPVEVRENSNDAPGNISGGLSSKIKQLEEDMGISVPTGSKGNLASQVYLDEYGNETYYTKNICGGILILNDLNHVIKKGEVTDLLQVAKMEDLKTSSDLRKQVYGNTPALSRLTQEQYLEELQEKNRKKRQVDALEAQKQSKDSPKEKYSKPRPLIDSKLEKLNLFYDRNPDLQIKGMEPIKFISWIADERFEDGEIDYILGHPKVMQNPDIKAALIQKKQTN